MRKPEYDPCELDVKPPEGSDSRLRIVHAAYPLFAEQGYIAVSMQEIADAVPIHKATLYHHFHNKDDLFLAVVRMAMARLYGQIEEFIRQGGSAADQLTRVGVRIFQDSQSEFGRLMSDARQHLTGIEHQILVERCSDPWMLYERIFATAIETGELPLLDPTLAATMFVGLLHGQTWSVRMERIAPSSDEERARLLVDVLFGGLNEVYRNERINSQAAAD